MDVDGQVDCIVVPARGCLGVNVARMGMVATRRPAWVRTV